MNTLYYSDAYGIFKINIEDAVGESQTVSQRLFHTGSVPSIPDNRVTHLMSKHIDGYDFLIASMGLNALRGYDTWEEIPWGVLPWGLWYWGGLAGGFGVEVIKDEIDINTYADGYLCEKASITDNGILYLINRTFNRIEAYYGADFRDGYLRSPDYIYDGYSTPPLFADGYDTGIIKTIHVVSGESEALTGGTRIYVGQSIGMTIIDAFDQEVSDGYSAGLDSSGTSTFCSIIGGGAPNECIGGSVKNISDISTDEENGIIFVATSDGYGNGGLTQISIGGNRAIIFMTEESGFIPSNEIRDIKNE